MDINYYKQDGGKLTANARVSRVVRVFRRSKRPLRQADFMNILPLNLQTGRRNGWRRIHDDGYTAAKQIIHLIERYTRKQWNSKR